MTDTFDSLLEAGASADVSGWDFFLGPHPRRGEAAPRRQSNRSEARRPPVEDDRRE